MHISNFQSFETERLFLRPTLTEDASFVLELFNSPKCQQFIGDRNLRTLKDAEDYISRRMHRQLERLGFSNYTVIRKSDKLKIGSCGLYDREGLDNIDLGFAFLPEHENKGYAYEASQALVKAAQKDFGLPELCAITREENTASRKLLEKLGFLKQEKVQLPDDSNELLLYRLGLS